MNRLLEKLGMRKAQAVEEPPAPTSRRRYLVDHPVSDEARKLIDEGKTKLPVAQL